MDKRGSKTGNAVNVDPTWPNANSLNGYVSAVAVADDNVNAASGRVCFGKTLPQLPRRAFAR
jgi:hypothetical protein